MIATRAVGPLTPDWLIGLEEGVGGLTIDTHGSIQRTPDNEDPVLLEKEDGRASGR